MLCVSYNVRKDWPAQNNWAWQAQVNKNKVLEPCLSKPIICIYLEYYAYMQMMLCYILDTMHICGWHCYISGCNYYFYSLFPLIMFFSTICFCPHGVSNVNLNPRRTKFGEMVHMRTSFPALLLQGLWIKPRAPAPHPPESWNTPASPCEVTVASTSCKKDWH